MAPRFSTLSHISRAGRSRVGHSSTAPQLQEWIASSTKLVEVINTLKGIFNIVQQLIVLKVLSIMQEDSACWVHCVVLLVHIEHFHP
jgi:hypothetical protein